MKKRERGFTIILAPSTPGKIYQVKFTTRRIYYTIFSSLVLFLGAGYCTLRYFHAVRQLGNYDELLAKNSRVQEENTVFRQQTGQLAERVSHMELMANTISNLTGVTLDNPRSETGGRGGLTPDQVPSSLQSNQAGLLPSIEAKASVLEQNIIRLKEAALEQNLLLSSMPTHWPLLGYLASSYGYRVDPINGQREFHEGLDISAPYGVPVRAPSDGVVIFAGAQTGYGYTVLLSHRYGITTLYGHLSRFAVRTGQTIRMNDVLGYVGSTGRSTGPHLHYETRLNGRAVNPMRFLGSPTMARS